MANFKRYMMVIRRDENGFATPALKVRKNGDVLKFDEVKELLNSSDNISSTEICDESVCAYCKHNPCKLQCYDHEKFLGRKLRTC